MSDQEEQPTAAVSQEGTSGANSPTSEAASAASSATASPSTQPRSKIDILLKATGDAPIMKKRKWAVEKCKKTGWIVDFIKKYLKCDPSDSVFVYVNQSFAPSPDVDIGTLYNCFGSDNKLVLHYCKTQAWG